MTCADRPGTRLATRLAFFVAGFGVACWAPLIPFAKARLAVDDGALGVLLLCLGMGSVAAMTFTGLLAGRYGSKPIILAGAFGLALVLPLLTVASTPLTLGAALIVFGGALGSLDVAMNIHAVEVERAAPRPLMSGFHGLYSVGGFAGSLVMTALLATRLTPWQCALMCALAMALIALPARPRLLRRRSAGTGTASVWPRGIVLLLALLAGITFLAEGAVLDWGALLITRAQLVDVAQGGWGYVVFSIAMTAGRLCGDAVVARVGDRATMVWGSVCAMTGFVVVVTAMHALVAMTGFLLIGLGASNIVPVLFRGAGTQTAMSPALAVAAISTVGYAGVLVGPAAIGFVAKLTSLPAAFGLLAALLAVVALSARAVALPRRARVEPSGSSGAARPDSAPG